MFVNRPTSIAFIALSSLLSACGGDSGASDPELKLSGPNQVKVFKSNNSIQCEGKGIPLNEMQLELAKAGIDVICAQEAHDGFGHPAMCGTSTGQINVYVIHSSNLPDAEKLGYKSVQQLSEYKDKTCIN